MLNLKNEQTSIISIYESNKCSTLTDYKTRHEQYNDNNYNTFN